jgi:Class III cytochrome C family
VRWPFVIAVVLAACGAAPTPPTTAPIFASPGMVIVGHAKLACNDCHVDDLPEVSSAKCATCHAAVQARVAAGKGLHGSTEVRGKECTNCHTDHRGMTFEALGWKWLGGRQHFDHGLAGWPLGSGHRVLPCDRCHTAKSATNRPTFLGVTTTCESCHAPPHAGTPYVKRPCEQCHNTDRFSDTRQFDHNEHAEPIGASHRRVACVKCHTPELGAKPPSRACETCHDERPHGARFTKFGNPPACATCHAPSTFVDPTSPPARTPWRPNAFDHTKNGKWPLAPFHTNLTCRSCHRGTTPVVFEKLSSGTKCDGCHEHAKVHDNRYTNAQCTGCHVAGQLMIAPAIY